MWRFSTAPQNIPALTNGLTSAISNISSLSNLANTSAAQIAAIIGAQNAGSSGGISVNEDFSTYNGGPLPSAKWNTPATANSYYFGVYIPFGAAIEAVEGITATLAYYYQQANPASNVRHYAQHTTQMTTDSVSIQAVFGSNGQNDQFTSLFSHASSSMDNFIYANFFNNHVYLGHGSLISGSWSFTDFTGANIAMTVNNGDRVELRNSGTSWSVLVNGFPVIAYTDTGGSGFYDSSHRYWGYTLGNNLAGFALADISFGITSINASDIAVPATLGVAGWRLYRASTSFVSLAGSGNQFLGSGTLDTVERTLNVTQVDTAGLGGIQIKKEGWYQINFRALYNSTAGSFGSYRALIVTRNATITDTPIVARVGADFSANANSASISSSLYLKVNNIVYPGIYQGGSNSIGGEAVGAYTWWEGMLSNA